MGNSRINQAMGQFLQALNDHEAAGKTDGQLLALFIDQRDDQAFAALMRRHGAMIIGVCRRILGNAADADDAYQATFLVFVRKAKSLKSRALLGDWLHGVARRTALKVKANAARRRRKEQAMAKPEAQGDETRDEWLPLLDEELSRLPEKYRLAIILCDLEGRTRQEAARQLGWPEGTVAGRLARARAMLHKRLVRRGVTLSLAALTTVLSQKAALASVPATLASSTLKAAALVAAGQFAAEGVISAKVATLTGEVMKTLLLSKLKYAAVMMIVCAVGGFGWVAVGGVGNEPGGVAQVEGKEKKTVANVNASKPISDTKEADEIKSVVTQKDVTVTVPSARELITNLQVTFDLKDFQQAPMTIGEGLGLIYDHMQRKGKNLPVLIDQNAFKYEGHKEEIKDMQMRFPSYPEVTTAEKALKMVLNRIQSDNPMGEPQLLVRDGAIWITTQKQSSLPVLMQQKVIARFENRAFVDVVQALSEQTGVSISLDPRIEKKADTRINATFFNDVNLEGALRIVADMAGLKVVNMKSGLYITTPANAKDLESELRKVPEVTPMRRQRKEA